MWHTENFNYFEETPSHPQKIRVWCAISRRLFGLIFFEKSDAVAIYQNMLQNFIDQLDLEELQSAYFQHDGATAHTA